MGRRKKDINEKQVLKLAELQCTNVEIAAFFDVDESTIRDRFPDIIKKGKEAGKRSLRRIQFGHAKKSTAMAIWLGKQWLGQKDSIEELTKTDIIIEMG